MLDVLEASRVCAAPQPAGRSCAAAAPLGPRERGLRINQQISGFHEL
jgi:hypothetical protein